MIAIIDWQLLHLLLLNHSTIFLLWNSEHFFPTSYNQNSCLLTHFPKIWTESVDFFWQFFETLKKEITMVAVQCSSRCLCSNAWLWAIQSVFTYAHFRTVNCRVAKKIMLKRPISEKWPALFFKRFKIRNMHASMLYKYCKSVRKHLLYSLNTHCDCNWPINKIYRKETLIQQHNYLFSLKWNGIQKTKTYCQLWQLIINFRYESVHHIQFQIDRQTH